MNRAQKFSMLYFVAATFLLWGYAIGKYEIFPYAFVEKKLNELEKFYQGHWAVEEELPEKIVNLAKEQLLSIPVQQFVRNYGNPHLTLSSAIRLKPDEMLQLNSWWNDGLYIRLLDHKGRIVKKWKYEPEQLDRANRLDLARTGIYGGLILSDGSALIEYHGDERSGVIKLDKCGERMWNIAGSHHLISTTPRGTFWVARGEKRDVDDRVFGAPLVDEFLVEFDQSGKILRNISFVDLLYDNGLHALLFPTGRPEVGSIYEDPIHLNDVEELYPEAADSFSLFNSGDVLISARNLNLILVFNPETKKVIWYQTGPFLRQHDVDFQPNGTITVFNNNTDETSGNRFGGSNILEIEPESRSARIKYRAPKFYSRTQGEHQILSDGRMVVAESTRGRVFMVDEQGKLIFEYIEKVDGEIVRQSNVRIYTKDYFEKDIQCRNG